MISFIHQGLVIVTDVMELLFFVIAVYHGSGASLTGVSSDGRMKEKKMRKEKMMMVMEEEEEEEEEEKKKKWW